jgi:adenosylcobinamide kinase/adenosylcobinamide-phosphate guanylyltransferase
VDLAEAIAVHNPAADVMLVDCLTLWLSNLLMETQDVSRIRRQINAGRGRKDGPHGVILVSNEVGAGIVPENRVARLYRDLAGWTNQAMAAACDRVVWTVAGIPVTIKPPIQNAPHECIYRLASIHDRDSAGKTETLRPLRASSSISRLPDWPSA